MLKLLLVLWLASPVQDTADAGAAYEAVLVSVHGEHASSALYLANLPTGRYRISKDALPHRNELLHSAAWVAQLRQRELIAGSCTPPEGRVGCRGLIPMRDPEAITVQFWPVDGSRSGPMEVAVTLVLPPIRGMPNIEKRVYRLDRAENGAWRVVSHTQVGIT